MLPKDAKERGETLKSVEKTQKNNMVQKIKKVKNKSTGDLTQAKTKECTKKELTT